MLQFGLIGCGTHAGWAVVPAIGNARGCRLAAAADISPDNLEKIKDESVVRYTDYREMLARERLDAVFIATPPNAHCEPALAALEAGLHVLTEKPMAMTPDECRRMVAAADAAGRVLAVDFECRYYPGYRQARKWIQDGLLGEVHAFHLDHMWDGHKKFGPLADRRGRTMELTGCLDCGIHRIDIARYLCGGGAWHDVRATGAWFGEDSAYPPHISIVARLEPGILFTMNCSFSLTAYIEPALRHDSLAIVGTKGAIVRGRDKAEGVAEFHLVSEALTASCPVEAKGHDKTIVHVVEDFVKVAGGAPFPPELASGEDGLMAQICTHEANTLAVEQGDVCAARVAQ